MKKLRILITAAIIVLFAGAFFAASPALVRRLLPSNGLHLAFVRLGVDRDYRLTLSQLTVTDPATGIEIKAEQGVFRPAYRTLLNGRLESVFALHNVRFVNAGTAIRAGLTGTDQIIAIPFLEEIRYAEMRGLFRYRSNKGFVIEAFSAKSGDVHIFIPLLVVESGTVRAAIKLSFSPRVLADVPDEIKTVVMADEQNGWKTIELNLEGDARSPSLQISGKNFRLSIKGK